MNIEQRYFETLVAQSQAYEAEYQQARWIKQRNADIVQKYKEQEEQAKFAQALIPQLPPELVPLLEIRDRNKAWIAGTNIEIIYSGPAYAPIFQKFTLQQNHSEHFNDYRLALARLAEIRNEYKAEQERVWAEAERKAVA